MTKHEFIGPFNDLKEHFGDRAFTGKRAKLLWEKIQTLPVEWWQDTADRMILSNDLRYDIYAAAKTELGLMFQEQRINEEIEAWKNLTRNMSEAGFSEALEKFKAKSLWEAIENQKIKPPS